MNATANITGTADANGILGTISQASDKGFLHIVLFLFILGLFWYLRQMQKDREATRDKRDQEWINHMALHNQEQKSINDRLDEFERNLSGQINLLLAVVQSLRGVNKNE